jgi:hypothetical protein
MLSGFLAASAGIAPASTYVVSIPLDSPIYKQLDVLDGAGLLDTYLAEIKPISRMEAARLVLEAEQNLANGSEAPDPLVEAVLRSLRRQLPEEIGWLESGQEDKIPTLIHPLERAEAQYIFSRGESRDFNVTDRFGETLQAEEATPLLPNNDNLPTSAGSNEVVRASGWAGLAGMFTAYGEGAMAGPLTQAPKGIGPDTRSRFSLLRGQFVASLGNVAVSFGQEEMAWGTGYFGSLSQSNNAEPFPALRLGNIHPSHLPWIFRYLGPFRVSTFFGELDHYRRFSRPWICGQAIEFKPLPTFSFGIDHAIDFGGRFNDHYGLGGFFGRATGFSTGEASAGNTNGRAGMWGKFVFPSLRNTVIYQEAMGEDNLKAEVPKIGGILPWAGVSFQGGVYVPRLTADGLTNARFEYCLTSQRYSTHSDSLYWNYKDTMMGYFLGPNATRYDLQFGRWINRQYEAFVDFYFQRRDPLPRAGIPKKEQSAGVAFDAWELPMEQAPLAGAVTYVSARVAGEYVSNINYTTDNNFRALFELTFGLSPTFGSLTWH